MAIQIPNPGTGNGNTGDNEFVMWTKVKDNFNNQTHAASRLVGTEDEQIPSSKDTFKAAFRKIQQLTDVSANINSIDSGVIGLFSASATNAPPPDAGEQFWIISTIATYLSNKIQIAYGYNTAVIMTRSFSSSTWSKWLNGGTNPRNYKITTAAGANVVVIATGELQRSTSSERYKDIIADLELDDVSYANAMQLAPIVYRSTADADNPEYHYYSFSAEALGAYDPAFALWRETETVTDAEGNVTEQPLDERQAEGINLNAIVAFLHATNVKQGKLISALEAKVTALEKEV
ncbi:pyocin knob domain-containing protein [Psychrobacter sp. T6-6]|uniref:pyocin knob domain-containing protein n=1 Tax=Psychrobacter sp. T6-6 TaxID=3457452 RepID=UPI003FCFE0ED